jgi:hypothetical protein
MLRHLIPDLLRRFRMPATSAGDVYQKFRSDALTVGTTPIRLVNQPIPSDFVMVMASITNTGIVYIGGETVSADVGIELDAGRALAFSPSPIAMQSANMQGQTALGLLPYIEGMSALEQRQYVESLGVQLQRAGRRFVINIADIWVVADSSDQNVRFIYTLPFGR